MTDKDHSAFPIRTDVSFRSGLSKREYFAAMAMQGLMVQCIPGAHNANTPPNNKEVARFAVDVADELISQLNQK